MKGYARMKEMEPEEEMMSNVVFSYEQLPEAKSWKDGEEYNITVRQVSHDEESAEFEVVDAGGSEIEDEDYGE